ncbi:tetratricopeptide repeat protein 28-like [Acanthaster planci]|uniref:Tetratricopeptide repeat protein 28-like n=1 Tax=Acanthaster planci TaxID=133434 RepID=A0A8B7XW87_ACAPL|nr:tetratricopeptide repeat protein 28-like [Acanthaster planci]XP_022085132.1 tetratricopeptide repeat protein 28-like [Acanthaster planci]XP_022085133.1 tetratricopeptide repeat protein 28-like [Acanthaster planci]
MEFQHSASMASLPSLTGFSEAISEAEEIESVKRLQQQGDAAFQAKDFALAAACYGEALEIDTDNAQLLARKTISNIELGECAEARKDAEYLIKLNPHVPQGHYLLAVSLNNLQEFNLAISAFLNALHYDVKHRDRLADNVAVVAGNLCNIPPEALETFADLSPAEKLLEVGINLKRANQNASCIEVLQSALDLKTLDELCQQRALFSIGAGYAGNTDYESAKDFYKQCLSIALQQKNQRYEAEVYCRLAEIYIQEESLEQGILYYVKLLSICQDLEKLEVSPNESCDVNLLREVHETLSNAYKAVCDFPHALKHAQKNLEVLGGVKEDFQMEKSDLLGKAHFTVASLHEAVEDFVSSLGHFKSYLAIAKASNDRAGMGRAYGCIGRIYHKLYNYSLAQSFYEQQLHISEKLSYHTMQATALRSLANVHEDFGNTDRALECLQRYLQISRKLDEFATECLAFIAMGELHQAHGNPQHAQHFYEQALHLAERSHETELAYASRSKLAQVLLISRAEKDLERARMLAGDSIEYYIQALKDPKQNKENTLKYLEQSYKLIQVALKKLTRPYEALEYAETQMRREFLNMVAKNTASLGQGTEAVQDLLSSYATIDEMLKIANKETATVVYLSLCHSCVLSWVFRPGEGCWTGKDDQDAATQDCPRHIQNLISSMRVTKHQADEAYETEYRALPLRDSKIHQLKTMNFAKTKRGASKTTSLDAAEDESSSKTKESPSRKLHKLLLSQVECLLEGCSSVVIVADRELAQVPFDALEDEEGYLFGDRYHLTLLPCLEALKYTHKHSSSDSNQNRAEIVTNSQKSPTHPIYLDHMLRVVIPPKERPHSIVRETDAEAPKMSQNSTRPSYISFDLNSYHFIKSPKDRVSVMEDRFLRGRELSGSTLISRTWSGPDLPSAHEGKIQHYQQQNSQLRALVIGNPALPKKLRLHGKIWEPLSELHIAQEEAHRIAHRLDTKAIVGSKVTKETVLTELPKSSLIHLAMYGSWEQACLACTPNPTSQPLADRSHDQSDCVIGVDDIIGLKLQAKLVVMSCCYGNRHRDVHLELPLAFLVAGAESILLLLWSVPDITRDKFWHHFYLALQEGRHVSEAVAQAKNSLREDERFRSPRYLGAFCLLGGDPFISLLDVKHGMLDQFLNTMEETYLSSQKQDVLNIRKVDEQEGASESLPERMRKHLSGLLQHHAQYSDAIPQLVKLLSHCLHLTDPQSDHPTPPSAQSLPPCILRAPSAIPLLNQLGFHFQAAGSGTLDPQVVFPQWDPDSIIEPALQALKGLQDICEKAECAHNLARVLESQEKLLSGLIDVMSFTKHMPEIQLKVNDTGVSHLWGHHQARALLTSLGFAQVGQFLMFDGTTANKRLLHAALLVLCSTMGEKGHAMLHRLDIRYLGISTKSPILRSARKTPIKSALRSASTNRTMTPSALRSCTPTAVRLRTAPIAMGKESTQVKSLPSLNPVKVSKNKFAFSTPWWSQPTKSPEVKEKMRLARSLSDLHLEYARRVQHTRNWHVESITPQAQKSLSAIGQPKPRTQVVKVKADATPSCSREPVNRETELGTEAIEQRRDYSRYLLHARNTDVERRHVDAVQKIFQPYVSQRTAAAVIK